MRGFDDLLAANAVYSDQHDHTFDGIAHAGVAMVTCMDSRLEPLEMIGLRVGDAKIMRTPGGRVTSSALTGCVVAVQLLQVDRILVVPHTLCMMAKGDDDFVRSALSAASGLDAGGMVIGADPDQQARLADDVALLRTHPMIAGRAEVGGFLYDVETGRLRQLL
ncbi:MAG: carbonic anhydrase [Micropruina sp.]|nr:carbonic anhydrase [Micropruina sp.]